MKKMSLFIAMAFVTVSTNAQTFTIPHDTVAATVNTMLNMHNDITNTTSSSMLVTWRVVNHDLPNDWAASFAICDNALCYYNFNNSLLGGNNFTTDPIAPSTTANFYVLPDLTNATTTGTYFVQIRMTDGTNSKMSWYIISKFPTSVSVVQKSDASIVAYPNPATDIVTILTDQNFNADHITITDLEGKVIAQEKTTGNSTSLKVQDYSSGLYFVKLIGADGQVIGTTKFTK